MDIAEPAGVDRWIECDLSDPAAVEMATNSIDGPIDALINNAGLPPREGLACKVLEVNVFGMRSVALALLPKIAKGGSVVTTASRAGAAWRENLSQVKALLALEDIGAIDDFLTAHEMDATRAYNLSKEAAIVWTALQTERFHAAGVRINSVSPAPVATGILDDFVAAFGDKAKTTLARVGRAGAPDEIAEVICFLISPEAKWINGQDIVVDGGMAGMLTADAINETS